MMLGLSDIISLLIVLIALAIALATLQQNRNIHEESNRPYITVYLETIKTMDKANDYVILKNFGNTGAYIDKLVVTPPYKSLLPHTDLTFFDACENLFVAPGQSFITMPYLPKHQNPIKIKDRTFELEYHTASRTYKETITLNEFATRFQVTSDGDYKKAADLSINEVIAKSTAEILRHNL
ncbi:hypothetical protein [Eubacterium callanderi]|uniref:hypothetical protein n=1 Tax=Eubacterium callanderi TaxID=53442 RepID=UPI001C115293|nr:hypothetical protein [Eubacterium callanderi]MBU5305486.1 hypothetical protein [Eubacterium callanderi]